jgi:hypothetical protein
VDDESKCPVTGKRKYATEGEALATAAHQIATGNAPKELRAYLCSWCDAWHLTKDGGRRGKDRRYANNYFGGYAPATIRQFRDLWSAKSLPELRKPQTKARAATLFDI